MLMKKLLNMEPKEVQHTYNWRSQVNYRLEMMKLGNQWNMSLKTEEIFPVKVRKTPQRVVLIQSGQPQCMS